MDPASTEEPKEFWVKYYGRSMSYQSVRDIKVGIIRDRLKREIEERTRDIKYLRWILTAVAILNLVMLITFIRNYSFNIYGKPASIDSIRYWFRLFIIITNFFVCCVLLILIVAAHSEIGFAREKRGEAEKKLALLPELEAQVAAAAAIKDPPPPPAPEPPPPPPPPVMRPGLPPAQAPLVPYKERIERTQGQTPERLRVKLPWDKIREHLANFAHESTPPKREEPEPWQDHAVFLDDRSPTNGQ